jgi:uncharacterized membrane protein
MQWFYIHADQRVGPVEESELFRLAREGQLSPDHLVWNPTMGPEWQPASTVPGLFDIPSLPVPAGRCGLTPNAHLMAMARLSLRGNWAIAVGACLLFGLISNTFGIASEFGSPVWKAVVTGLSLLISIFISGPLAFGLNRFFLRIARRERPDLNRLFDGFRIFWKSVGTSWLVGLYILLALLPLCLPLMAAAFVAKMLGTSMPAAAIGFFLLLCIPALIPSILVALNYSLVYFILSDHPELPVSGVLARSRELMYGFRWKYACLGARFIGWIILAIFTCGIGFLWVQPYMITTNAHFYEDVQIA